MRNPISFGSELLGRLGEFRCRKMHISRIEGLTEYRYVGRLNSDRLACVPSNSNVKSIVTRNSSGDEIANVNFLYDDIVHTTKYNGLVHKFRHRSTRLCVGTHVFTKFSKITQYNGHYVVKGHPRSPILVPMESPYATSY